MKSRRSTACDVGNGQLESDHILRVHNADTCVDVPYLRPKQ